MITARWDTDRPFLSGGPLSDKYIFSQIHFHWGRNASEGSEHSVDGSPLPLEMHAAFYKNSYGSPEEALQHTDGMICLAYLYKINYNNSEKLENIFGDVIGTLEAKSFRPLEPFMISDLLIPFESDYYLYWGTIGSSKVQWLITREVQHLSLQQLKFFHGLLHDDQKRPITRNYHAIQPKQANHRLFHVNPIHKTTNSTLSPIMPALEEQKWKARLAQEAAKFFIFDNKDQILPDVQIEEIIDMKNFEDEKEDGEAF